MENEWLNTAEAAAALNISITTLWRMRNSHSLPKASYCRFRGCYRYNVHKIRAAALNK